MLELRSGDALVAVDAAAGGRIERLRVHGLDLLLTPDDDDRQHGCFPMAPWAGRTGYACFTFDGAAHDLPVNNAPHAIHGTVRDRPWTVEAADDGRIRLATDLGPVWPFAGWVEQTVALFDDRLELAMSVHAARTAMPAVLGWHPWFRRSLGEGSPAAVDIDAAAMIRRGGDHLPVAVDSTTWDLVRPPPPGPWDDCFVELRRPPVIRWDGAIEVEIDSDCPCVVVYDEQAGAVCVEPQTAPPDALNHDPPIAVPGRPLTAHTTWRWSTPA